MTSREQMRCMNLSAPACDHIPNRPYAKTRCLKGFWTDAFTHHNMEAIAYRNLDRPSYMGSTI